MWLVTMIWAALCCPRGMFFYCCRDVHPPLTEGILSSGDGKPKPQSHTSHIYVHYTHSRFLRRQRVKGGFIT